MKNSLTAKLIVSFVSLLVFILFLSFFAFNEVFNQHVEEEQSERAKQLQRVIEVSIAPSLFSMDIASVNHLAQELMSQTSYLNSLRIRDSRGLEIFSNQVTESSESIFEFEIRLYDEMVGRASFQLSTKPIEELKAHFLLWGGVILFVGVLMAALSIFWLSRFLTKDLSRLSEAMNQLAVGQYHHPIEVLSHDEIGILARHFNEMQAAIKFQTSALEMEQRRLNTLLNNMNLGIVFENEKEVVTYVNNAFFSIWNLIPSKDKNQSIESLVKPSEVKFKGFFDWRKADLNKHKFEKELSDGRTLMISSIELSPLDEFSGRLWILNDVTKERKMQESLVRMASFDALTGLLNRHRFQIEMDRLISFADRGNYLVVLVMFDIDDFKTINDRYGHVYGDQVLVRLSNQIKQSVAQSDLLFRLGGDEFALLSLVQTQAQIPTMVEKLINSISNTYHHLEGDVFRLTSSAGVATYPQTSLNEIDLIAHADIAMYASKARGKNAYCIFDESLIRTEQQMEKITWSDRIEKGLQNDLFVLHFQGVHHADDLSLSHYEALIRLKEEGADELIPPIRFIPMAEKTGQIVKIDRYVLKEAIQTLANHACIPKIAINLSGKTFEDHHLPMHIENLLDEYGVDPSRLAIELTETSALSDVQDASLFISNLKKIGCVLCLDDFGTGFASFAYLKQLDVDVLKIDGSFVKDLAESDENRIIVRSMVAMANGLGRGTIAEFVHNAETMNFLREVGVTKLQGFHLSKPEPLSVILQTLKTS